MSQQQDESDARPVNGATKFWIGQAVVLSALLIAGGIGWGELSMEVATLKERQSNHEAAGESARLELKHDFNTRLDSMQVTLNRIEDKLDRVDGNHK